MPRRFNARTLYSPEFLFTGYVNQEQRVDNWQIKLSKTGPPVQIVHCVLFIDNQRKHSEKQ